MHLGTYRQGRCECRWGNRGGNRGGSRCGGRTGRCGRGRCSGLRGGCRGAGTGFHLDQQGTFADLGTELHQHFLDHAGNGGRDIHRGLVGFEGGDGVIDLDAVADLHKQIDHRHVGEVADIRHLDFNQRPPRCRGGSRRCSRCSRRSRGCRCCRSTAFHLDQQCAFADAGTELYQHFRNHAGHGRGDIHGRFVGFEGGDGVINLDRVADLNK